MRTKLVLLFSWLPLCLSSAAVVAASSSNNENAVEEGERAILLQLYKATAGAQWKNSWDVIESGGIHHCDFWGVSCRQNDADNNGPQSRRVVVAIELPQNRLKHEIPNNVVSQLEYLEILDLHGNPITGFSGLSATPDTNSQSNQLQILDISDTKMDSSVLLETIASGTWDLSSLKSLKMGRSSTSRKSSDDTMTNTATFPMDVCQKLNNLEVLHLTNMGLSGTLPNCIFGTDLSQSLRELDLSGNVLTAELPTELGQLIKLEKLNLANNHWASTIPDSINELENLQLLSLQGTANPNDDNDIGRLHGPLPSLHKATNLQHVFLNNNALSGTIPSNFLQNVDPNLDAGISIHLEHNILTGTIPSQPFAKISNLHLGLSYNKFVGPLPDIFCNKFPWMNGAVAEYGCDAILCHTGTYSSTGQAPCEPCEQEDEDPVNNINKLGATTCGNNNNIDPSGSGGGAQQQVIPIDPSAQHGQQVKILAQLYLALDGKNWQQYRWNVFDDLLADAESIRDGDGDDENEDVFSILQYVDLSSIHACTLPGIICGSQGYVEILNLSNNNMVGTIPEELFHLPNLRSLDLSYNRVELQVGAVDGAVGLGALQFAHSLTRLRLSHTSLGSLLGIGQGQHLTELLLDGCDFHGSSIHPGLYELSNLHTLHLEASFLGGTIAPEIRQLSHLKRLNLNENKLTGSIPKEIAFLPLEYLDLSDNFFGFDLPPDLGAMPELISMRINSARGGLGGPLPSFAGLSKIEELELAFNAFSGTIPTDFLNSRQSDGRFKVRLTGNKLSGALPKQLGVFSDLILEIEDNQITGIADELCRNPGWMSGEVGLVSPNPCDAILCANGTWSPQGRAISKSNVQCEPCEGNQYFGESVCETEGLQSNFEVRILDKLFAETGGRYWNAAHTNWTKPGVPICYREGVLCGWKPADMNSDVTELRLNGFGLRGRIPTEIFRLPKLRRLAVASNPVDVSFEGIENAPILEILSLSHTDVGSLTGIEKAGRLLYGIQLASSNLKGPFPEELLKVRSLRGLHLDDNQLTGEIPTLVGTLTDLEQLHLSNNKFEGPLPLELGSLQKLKTLDISSNQLSGLIPAELEDLVLLERLNIASQESDARFSGPLPSFSTHQYLTHYNASWNSFEGAVPSGLLSTVDKNANVQIDLSNNKLTGPIPEDLEEFQMLSINLAANMIDGLPEALCRNSDWMNGITGLVDANQRCDTILCPPGTFNIHGNQRHRGDGCIQCDSIDEAPYYGSTSCFDPTTKQEREALMTFAIETNVDSWFQSSNWVSDRHVCTWYGVVCNGLNYVTKLRLADNNLRQPRDSSVDLMNLLTQMPNLKELVLDNNDLNVSLENISTESPLDRLSLSNVGLVSLDGFSRATKLQRFEAIGNRGLTGSSLPNELFEMTLLRDLYLSNNRFKGRLPTELFGLPFLEKLSLPDNDFSGTIPSHIGQMSKLRELVLSGNQLSGSLPDAMNELTALTRLSLSGQNGPTAFTGKLPDFAEAPRLWYFDVSSNKFSGSIPETFLAASQALTKEVRFYANDNEITGTIPSSFAQFERLDIRLANNRISGIPKTLCDQTDWFGGSVGTVGSCDAILCPKGYFAEDGRQTSIERPCLRCESLLALPFLGQTLCTDESERNILRDLFSRTGGTKWSQNHLWNTNEPVCSWYGIECNGEAKDDKGVKAIKLISNNMVGTLPGAVLQLSSLQQIDVSDNMALHFSFDGIVKPIRLLEHLNVSSTMTSSIEGVSKASKLKEFSVTEISGTLPVELFRLTSLEILDISNSFLVGTLPSKIGLLKNLRSFLARGNDFHSTVPTEIGQLSNLEEFDMSENLLSGELPGSVLGSLPKLQRISVSRKSKSGRKITGPLPSFENSPSLVTIELDGNLLTGPIPDDFLASSSRLAAVDISGNALTGSPPETWANPVLDRDTPNNMLVYDWSGMSTPTDSVEERGILLDLYKACGGRTWIRSDFWGTQVDICNWYGVACNNGEVIMLNLQGNNLIGRLPTQIYQLPMLQLLWLSDNSALIPTVDGVQNATSLRDLKLDKTGLTSALLNGISKAKSITAMDISNNNLEGSFPAEILELENLRVLSLSNNTLEGALPSSFSSLPYLRVLDAENNTFTGTLPSWNDSVTLSKIKLGHNNLREKIPADFLARVRASDFVTISISLHGNRLSGSLPEELGRFQNLQLDIYMNRIDSIPATFCKKTDWNNGEVGKYGCDGIACPPGSSNRNGRRSLESPVCIACPAADPYFGQTDCTTGDAAKSSSSSSLPLSFFGAAQRAFMLLALIPAWGLLLL